MLSKSYLPALIAALAVAAGGAGLRRGCLRAAHASSHGSVLIARGDASQTRVTERPMVPHSGLPGYALVYARRRGGREMADVEGVARDVFWLPAPGDGGEREIYHGSISLLRRIPIDIGFLPSPDGGWVCVWETLYGERGRGEATKTVWTAVQLLSGRKLRIGSQPGIVGYLPYWSDSHTLLLEKGAERVRVDVATGRVAPRLPTERGRPGSSGERDVDSHAERAVEWRSEYLSSHFDRERKVVLQAQQSFPDELGIAEYLRVRSYPSPDTIDDVLLRPMGIVGLCGCAPRESKRVWPTVAVSPRGGLIARAAVLPTGEVTSPVPKRRLGMARTFAARLDVYELASGRRLWGVSVPWATTLTRDVAMVWGPTGAEAWFGDLRWSGDGRYLSFTWHQGGSDSVCVVDASRWVEVLRLPHASNAFVIASVPTGNH